MGWKNISEELLLDTALVFGFIISLRKMKITSITYGQY